MRIIQISARRERYMELLLMGDEQRDMVERYLARGDMFVCFDGDEPVAVCVAARRSCRAESGAQVRGVALTGVRVACCR